MRRTLWTVGLVAAVATAAWLAPRLGGAPRPGSTPPSADRGTLTFETAFDQGAIWRDGALVIRVHAPADVRAGALALALDASGSVGDRGFSAAADAARALAANAAGRHELALIAFDDEARVVTPLGPVDAAALGRRLDELPRGGGTNLYDGLATAGRALPGPGSVVLLTDGRPTVGLTERAAFAELAGSLAARGVSVSAVGLGPDYDEALLAEVAAAGGGRWVHVTRARELERALGQGGGAGAIVARDLRLDVELPAGLRADPAHGWSSTPREGGIAVVLPALAAGEHRLVVIPVRGAPSGPGEARVAATWTEAGAAAAVALSAPTRRAVDAAEAARTRDPRAAADAARAEAAALLARAADARAGTDHALRLAASQGDPVGRAEWLKQARAAAWAAARSAP